jgi:hypothetical protein
MQSHPEVGEVPDHVRFPLGEINKPFEVTG